ncbi:MAG: proprotein convertase P-domain-containing protein [Kofleriaceae bacterium]
MSFRRFALVGFLAAGLAACAEGEQPLPEGLEIVKADVQDVSPSLAELAKAPITEGADERAREANPPRRLTHSGMRGLGAPQTDPVVQAAVGTALIPTTLANFEGMGTGLPGFTVQSAPPDTVGDIGTNHYVQVVNSSMTVFNRSGGVVLGPVQTRSLWSGFSGACATTNDGDGTVRFDRHANRWIIAQFSVNGGNGPFFQCVAVSTSADPTGTYNRYQFSYNAFNDYPKMGLWDNAYYFSFNMFPNNTFGGSKVCAMDRAKMIAGAAATMQCFDTNSNFGGLLPSDSDGPTLPAAGTPNYVVAFGTNELQFWKMKADFATPANASFVGPTLIPVAAFNPLCNGGTCVRQPGTAQQLDALSDRLMNRLVYRKFSTHESLIVSHAVTAGTGGGVRWYELRSPGTTPTVFQQGTYAPDSAYRFMSSIAMDAAGNIALGYAISSTSISPGVRYTGRLVTDPLGTMGQGEGTIVAGAGAQTGGLSRFGDYSSLNIDPVDDCTFWFTQEYIGATGSFNWRTRVGSFKFPSCGAAPGDDFTLSTTPSAGTVTAGSSTTFTINTSVLSGAAQSINLSVTGLPAGVTASFAPATVTAGGSSTLTVTAAASAAATTAQLTVTGTGTAATHSANIALTVANGNQAPTVTLTAPTNGSTVSGTITVSANAADADGTVASVRFDLPDGTTFTDTTAPYSTTFNTALVADGAGVVFRATATDNSGATSAPSQASVTVQNGGGGTCINGTFNATGLPLSIPDNNATGITSNLPVTGNGTVASLALSLNITHTYRGDLVVTLVSPGGTQFVVSNRAGGSADNLILVNSPITAFAGQVAAGTWQLKVQDRASIDVGTLNSWSLTIVGNCTPTTNWSASATPNLPTVDNGQVCSTVNVAGTGNAADVKLDLSGRHDYRSILRGTLAHNGVTATAFPTGTFPSGAGTFSFASRAVAGFTGSATGAWTLCLVDTDAFGDTGTLSSWSVHN